MKLFIIGFICITFGAVFGFITAALLNASGQDEKYRECQEGGDELC